MTLRFPILFLICFLTAAAVAQPARITPAGEEWVVGLSVDAGKFRGDSDSLRQAGFRPVSLDLGGTVSRPTFSASWIRKAGPAWVLLPPAPETEFHGNLAEWSGKGFRPFLVTVLDPDAKPENGQAGTTLFAAALERSPSTASVRTGDRARFQAFLDSAQRSNSICAWVDAHGPASHPRFTGIFMPNAERIAWNYSIGDDEAALHLKMDVFARVWVRPSFIAPIPGGRYLALWQENAIGSWSAHARLAKAEYGAALDREAAEGLHPISLQAVPGAGDSIHTVLMAGRYRPLPRQWTVTGPEAPEFASFDAYMKELMERFGVRAGALAMAKDGKLAFAHGYTWAEEGYPITGPGSLFRVASCSKPLTSILVHRILREGGSGSDGPSLKEKIFSLLKPAEDGPREAPADSRFLDITVDQLLTHSGGWARSRAHPDPVFNDFPPGSEIRNRLPSSRKDFFKYMLGQPLQFDPGSRSVYDNFGFFLLGRLIESLPMGVGKTYESMAEDMLFRPLGLSRPRFGESRFEDRAQDEVLYHTAVPYLQKNPDGKGPAWVPGGYGDFDLRNMDAAGAWILSAPDYAKVLAAFDLGDGNPILKPEGVTTMWAPSAYEKYLRGWFATRISLAGGDTVTAKWHNGLFPGTSTLVFYRPDKWSFALFLNRDIQPQLSGGKQGRELSRLADAVRKWPQADLFPEMGIPAFPAAGAVTAGSGADTIPGSGAKPTSKAGGG